MGGKYQCGNSGSKTSFLNVPEGIKFECKLSNSWIIEVATKCTVSCNVGSPNSETLTCRDQGWRPTNQLECSGVNAGVIIGALIGGLFAVVVIGLVFAKWMQRKNQSTSRPPTWKLTANSSSAAVNTAMVQKRAQSSLTNFQGSNRNSSLVGKDTGMENRSNASWKNGSQRSYPSSYTGSESMNANFRSKINSRIEDSYELSPYQHPSMQRPKSRGYDSGYYGHQYDNPPPVPYAAEFNSESYFQGQLHGSSYPYQQPAVGYGSLSHSQYFPGTGNSYPPPYDVPT